MAPEQGGALMEEALKNYLLEGLRETDPIASVAKIYYDETIGVVVETDHLSFWVVSLGDGKVRVETGYITYDNQEIPLVAKTVSLADPEAIQKIVDTMVNSEIETRDFKVDE
jgi:hypothetical protein